MRGLSNDRISDVEAGVPFEHNSIAFTILSACRKTSSSPNRTPNVSWAIADLGALQNYCEGIDWKQVLLPDLTVYELWSA